MDSEILLTVVVPAYNVEKYLKKCIYSMLPFEYPESKRLEILIINDGSKDNTATVANEIAADYSSVHVVNKENGGHGSTINMGINMARGKYLRIIDGDDWVDSQNFLSFLRKLDNVDCDLILTDAEYEYLDKKELSPYVSYELKPESIYDLKDVLTNERYFKLFGPILASTTYKVDCLRSANFKITEHSAYVDMELNAYCLECAHTLVYWPISIYRYLIGRSGQTVSPDVWKKKYKEHQNIIFNLIDYVTNKHLEGYKRTYIINKLIASMVDSQIFIYDQICKWDELKSFLKTLSGFTDIYPVAISYVYQKHGDSYLILKNFEKKITDKSQTSIIITQNSLNNKSAGAAIKYHGKPLLKKIIKCMLPYGLVRLYQKSKGR
ncbi:glycosyltransferase family 2 protein [Dialister hominis]|jgi:glycosyltransferase involved in cell wall biosynthesis|uniref:glycosyltransferase family 2 protein n=1 Tax=Dialister hominis TaxID=2582419 RepID=UPI0040275B37